MLSHFHAVKLLYAFRSLSVIIKTEPCHKSSPAEAVLKSVKKATSELPAGAEEVVDMRGGLD